MRLPLDASPSAVWVFLAEPVCRLKHQVMAVGFPWKSLDSLVQIEPFQWLVEDFPLKKFHRRFPARGPAPRSERGDLAFRKAAFP
jgi:hypothetical protein